MGKDKSKDDAKRDRLITVLFFFLNRHLVNTQRVSVEAGKNEFSWHFTDDEASAVIRSGIINTV